MVPETRPGKRLGTTLVGTLIDSPRQSKGREGGERERVISFHMSTWGLSSCEEAVGWIPCSLE